jgi:hypothetical protein
MDGDKFRNTMHSLNYGTVMEAAARNYIKEKTAEEDKMRAASRVRAMDARDFIEVRRERRVKTYETVRFELDRVDFFHAVIRPTSRDAGFVRFYDALTGTDFFFILTCRLRARRIQIWKRFTESGCNR